MSDLFYTPQWPVKKNIKSAITFRTGGVSQPPYHSLNLAQHVNDDEQSVMQNRQLLATALELPQRPCWLQQTHSDVVIATQQYQNNHQADAIWTAEKNQVCVVMTADCLPILLADNEKNIVAAVHAGWQGLANNIIGKTMQKAFTQSKNIMAYLGPCISAKHYLVKNDLLEKFVALDPFNQNAFQQIDDDSYTCDLKMIATQQLKELGVEQIYTDDFCSYANHDLFYSYRRAKQTGRMASLIWLES